MAHSRDLAVREQPTRSLRQRGVGFRIGPHGILGSWDSWVPAPDHLSPDAKLGWSIRKKNVAPGTEV